MIYTLKCSMCGAISHIRGHWESDTNATILNDDKPLEWEPENSECDHEDFEIIDSEYEQDQFPDEYI